jgi:hypothetical protein
MLRGKMSGKVHLFAQDVRQVEREKMPWRCNLLVSELLDHGGLGEGIIPLVRHAQQALTESSGAIILPAALEIRAVLVEVKTPPHLGVVSSDIPMTFCHSWGLVIHNVWCCETPTLTAISSI